MDPQTGLPVLPDGESWIVIKRARDLFYHQINYDYSFAVLQEPVDGGPEKDFSLTGPFVLRVGTRSVTKSRFFGLKTETVTERYLIRACRVFLEGGGVAYSWLDVTEEGIRTTARYMLERQTKREMQRALKIKQEREKAERAKPLFGEYPPKSLSH